MTVEDRNGNQRPKKNFEEAFGFAGYDTKDPDYEAGMRMRGGTSYDEENIRLAPYSHQYGGGASARVRGGRGGSGSDEGAGLSPYTSSAGEATELVDPVHVHQPKRGSGGPIGTAI